MRVTQLGIVVCRFIPLPDGQSGALSAVSRLAETPARRPIGISAWPCPQAGQGSSLQGVRLCLW
jgi:hypothetical protein